VRLRPKAGPLGRGVIRFDVRPHGDGIAVTIAEEPVSGLPAALPGILWRPLLTLRNHECLNRLAFLAEGRRAEREAGELEARPETPTPAEGTASPQAEKDAAEADI
jgi:hypothetical protein